MNWYVKVLQQYADFSGRARRKEFWMFSLINSCIFYGLIIIGITTEVSILMFVAVIYFIATLIPYYAVAVRRMHDIGKSGWYFLIPYYNIYLSCLNSEFGDNQYGEDPKSNEDVSLQKI